MSVIWKTNIITGGNTLDNVQCIMYNGIVLDFQIYKFYLVVDDFSRRLFYIPDL